MEVTWESPDPPNGVITRYNIRYTSLLTSSSRTVSQSASSGLSIVITDLLEGGMYSVEVRARTQQHTGPYSDAVTLQLVAVATSSSMMPTSTDILMTGFSSLSDTESSVMIMSSQSGMIVNSSFLATPTVEPTTPTSAAGSNLIIIVVSVIAIAIIVTILFLSVLIVICRKCYRNQDKDTTLKYRRELVCVMR